MTEIPEYSLSELIEDAMHGAVATMAGAIPARVESYDPATGRVSAQPVVRVPYVDEQGIRRMKRAPVVPAAQVCWPSGGGYSATFGIERGDHVLLVFCDRSLANWIGTGREGDPEHLDSHDEADAIAFPCPRPRLANWPRTSGARLGRDGGLGVQVSAQACAVTSGGSTERVVTTRDLGVLLAALQSAIVVPGDGGASLRTAIVTALSTAGWAPAVGDGQAGASKLVVERP